MICVPLSAKTGEGVNNLLENIQLVARSPGAAGQPDRLAKGAVIEAKLDKGRGLANTILVQNGTLHTGDIVGHLPGQGRVMLQRQGAGPVRRTLHPCGDHRLGGSPLCRRYLQCR